MPQRHLFHIVQQATVPLLVLFSTLITINGCLSTHQMTHSENGSLEEIVNYYFLCIDSIAEARALRLGVLPFAPTGRTDSENNEFGSYFSEKVINRMTTIPEKIRLYERSRLDALLKEHSFEMSGMISEADARKLGELIPIDYILTGTYTVLGTHLAISGRFIDVTTGEIIFSMNNECPINDEFAALLSMPKRDAPQQKQSITVTKISPGKKCEALREKLKKKVEKLPAQSQFAVMIREGMNIPFDTACRQIHYDIMERCKREHTNPPEYTRFLIDVLGEITDGWNDPRGKPIFHYFRADDNIDKKEWNSAITFLKKVKWVDRYLTLLFLGDTLTPQIEQRMRKLVPLCQTGKIGKTGVPFDVALYSVVKALRLNYEGGFGRGETPPEQKRREREFLKVLHMFKEQPFDSIPHLYCDALIRQWSREKYNPLSDSLFKAACAIFKKCPPEKRKKEIEPFASALIRDIYKNDSTRQFTDAARSAMEYFARTCRDEIAETSTLMSPVELSNSSVPALCLATGITSPAIITPDSISIMLTSENSTVQRKGFECLYFMGKRASIIQKKVTRVLRQRVTKNSGSGKSNEYLIKTIGAIAPDDPEVIKLLVSLLDDANPYFPLSDVTDALAGIGEPAVPFMKRYFEKNMNSHVFYTARFFENMGTDALPYCTYLKNKAASCSQTKTKYRLEDAVDRIQARK